MRLSLESRGPSTSRTGDGPIPARQVLTMQSRSGTLPARCSDSGGTP